MFQKLLKDKFEYFTRYFENAVLNEKHKIPQSIILYGQDNLAQYYLAQDIARILNCKNSKEPDCTCINCSWIRNNQHPAVLTISKNDNKHSDDTTKKVISMKQTQSVNNSLINTSEYYRVFVFCDSKITGLTKFQTEHLKDFASLGFKLPHELDGGIWYPEPLTREILQSEASNSLLKSIEEPPENVIFIFLTEDKEDLLETIVSRSQCFYIPSFLYQQYDTEFIKYFLKDYPDIKKADVLQLTQNFFEAKDDNGYSFDYAVDCIQFYLKELIRNNIDNKAFVTKLRNDIIELQKAKKQANSYVKPQIIMENFLFSIAV